MNLPWLSVALLLTGAAFIGLGLLSAWLLDEMLRPDDGLGDGPEWPLLVFGGVPVAIGCALVVGAVVVVLVLVWGMATGQPPT